MSKAIATKQPDLLVVNMESANTTAAYRSHVRAFLNSGYPQTVPGFATWIDNMRGVRPGKTVNLAISAGKAAFRQSAIRQGMSVRELTLLEGALSEIHQAKVQPSDVATVTPEERAKLFAALPRRVGLIAETLYQTGARVSEIVNLRRDHIRVNGKVVLRLYGKGRKERQVTITHELFGRILEVFPEGEYLFTTSQVHPYRREYVSREIDRAARRVLHRSVSAHVLRHSRATDLIAATGKVKGVSRLLGHANESTTLRFYVKESLTDEELTAGL